MNEMYSIFIVEIIISTIGITLLFYEGKILRPVITQKSTIALIGFLLAINLAYLSRVIGIYHNNPILRQYGAALFGLIASLCFIFWGTEVIELSKSKQVLTFISIILGMVFFMGGRLFGIFQVEFIGMILTGFAMIAVVFYMLIYVGQKSPYLRARHRILILSLSFITLIVFEVAGASFMSINQFDTAAMVFSFEIVSRMLVTIGIKLPDRLHLFLGKIVS